MISRVLWSVLATACLCGCFAPLMTLERRSAIEQQLTSAAFASAVANLDLSALDKSRAYALEVATPADADVDLMRAGIERRLAEAGVRVSSDGGAGVPRLHAAVPFTGVDIEATLLGVPFIVPGLPVALGDISVYRSSQMTGRARIELVLWEDGAPRPVAAAENARHYRNFTFLTFVGPFRTTDMAEKRRPGGS